MKNIGLIAVIAIVLIALMGGCSTYNGLVEKQEDVNSKWAQVQNVYQRRADLIPNLVNTVKGAANFEKTTLESVIQARANATRPEINLNSDQLTPENIQRFQQAQDALGSSLSRLLVVSEQYPALKANENFKELQAQLEGTDNRITVERQNFNNSVQDYNTSRRRFPNNIFAGLFGFGEKGYFQAQTGADKAPTVQF
ncbi:LemA family protein [Cytophagaceae bacterium DM2B3-1]|uniref:LemA family protein n=1 Tax=Xanthocytophaga flava TaxID=3048013 RepID=A0ABT7CCS5_9BACT|nr:LemA family protein [Xanthocytophaga flavus]MDJ1491412.1 LemA family protein [Xanthocytophaga flavus]